MSPRWLAARNFSASRRRGHAACEKRCFQRGGGAMWTRGRRSQPSHRSHRELPTSTSSQSPAVLSLVTYARAVGPGVMAGLADNDPAGVATYAIAGAVAGYRQLWLIVLATFMVQAVQVTSARLGTVTQQGVLPVVRRRYGWMIAAVAAVVGIIANEATL